MTLRRLLGYLLAGVMAIGTAYVPEPAESAVRSTSSKKRVAKRTSTRQGSSARRPAARKKATARPVATRKRSSRRPTAAQRAAERRRREAARREEARRRAAELERQRKALAQAWQPDKACYQSGGVVSEPRLRDDDPIEVPTDARGGSLKAALLMYEANVDKNGRLHSLRTLRPLPKDPPWPELHDAVVKSVTGWKWEKTKVAGKTIAVCFPLTLNLDLR